MTPEELREELKSWPYFGLPFALLWAIAAAFDGGTGLSPFGPSQQAVSSASPLPSHIAGEN